MIKGCPPFSGKKEYKVLDEYSAENHPPFQPPEKLYAHGLKVLIEDCWSEKPDKRPSFEKITERLDIDHRFFYSWWARHCPF
ncbi:hypothetical protein MLD38_037105 [Melastoma candidum]|uniref:Uncharacterized protein n=1 Tax=Melastoma candidum TaxID=119954 RepID=A0ACB9LLU8_9MYRT|nr:hypothetical protein MLD38_037105 [Melastoma candidum]